MSKKLYETNEFPCIIFVHDDKYFLIEVSAKNGISLCHITKPSDLKPLNNDDSMYSSCNDEDLIVRLKDNEVEIEKRAYTENMSYKEFIENYSI